MQIHESKILTVLTPSKPAKISCPEGMKKVDFPQTQISFL